MGEKIIGFHAIEEGLKKASSGSVLYIARGMGGHTQDLERQALLSSKVVVKKIAKVEMDRMVSQADHRGAVLDLVSSAQELGGKVQNLSVKDFCKNLHDDDSALILVLDEITDPQNLGAILRSADQFSVSLVVVPDRRSAHANSTVIKVSSGAAHYVPMAQVTNINREIEYLKSQGFWVYGAAMNGQAVYKTTFPNRTVLVMGNEGKGIGQLTQRLCDHMVSIPMTGHIDSLNVSVATGILLYEVRRQQATK
ncbi:23S rRNA (guanosine(2251)-2'-O)-methyltransferase RlmB [Sphaerochaeta halotolerans]|jgi:23S rRNA (guanosine2251-2'-O)-methyltransferase|uniref:23S rRNA (Guanosine(2251)-2'-O)-methyltransferase RlmB n=1 Tax=Sphaerochaeta halotolerans TaxID=2293840 RepID=A0A372MID0_9SPIR|nr:23S rRNA (guanosine(2251)-2'-O)-methyltransferase RlmB [Sphaerochaeta halotolerans]MBG0766033.1 23S rRNA (guanosine(2251)-2'-O)-methyltransferase RlmB [Spirochaetaceae bacterium]MDK2859921.1 rRNA (guanosine2251-2-O)-methyltransferase [Sphaerochaeta sp.]MXI87121.1 23S rRNA (guanosine(2251)-2'-O)-methyltransferase RlmB [Sphaerochaeta halotolerans]RFU95522.1 23S rRNA (guanosine(2251)-2'-O)-methyltransferase RlmB [Sphaerochaeta halotolerans]